MKIGDIFTFRHAGQHIDVKLIILQDYERNQRVVFNSTDNVIVGDKHILYAKFLRRATKQEIKYYSEKANLITKTL